MFTPASLLLGATLGLFQGSRILSHRDHRSLPIEDWPSHFEGSSLHAIDSVWPQLLYSQFTGACASFRSAGREVILRRTARGTRRLQATETALRESGYRISHLHTNGEDWLCYYAQSAEKRLHVREQITNGKQSWASPSPWFWHATLQPKSGPWFAITIITPVC